MSVLERVIESSLDDLGRDELAGAYRGICGMLLVHTALAQSRRPTSKKELARQRNQARAWLTSGEGLVTFGEACEVLGWDEGRMRTKIEALADKPPRQPINGIAFGVPCNADHDDALGGGQRGEDPQ